MLDKSTVAEIAHFEEGPIFDALVRRTPCTYGVETYTVKIYI